MAQKTIKFVGQIKRATLTGGTNEAQIVVVIPITVATELSLGTLCDIEVTPKQKELKFGHPIDGEEESTPMFPRPRRVKNK